MPPVRGRSGRTLEGCQKRPTEALAATPGCNPERRLPGVAASLRPPATVWQPSGLRANAPDGSGDAPHALRHCPTRVRSGEAFGVRRRSEASRRVGISSARDARKRQAPHQPKRDSREDAQKAQKAGSFLRILRFFAADSRTPDIIVKQNVRFLPHASSRIV
jgi:hypothetical protein